MIGKDYDVLVYNPPLREVARCMAQAHSDGSVWARLDSNGPALPLRRATDAEWNRLGVAWVIAGHDAPETVSRRRKEAESHE